MEVFGEVYFGFTLLDSRGGHSIILVMEYVFRDETAQERVHAERPYHRKAGWVMRSEVHDVGVRRLRGSSEEES